MPISDHTQTPRLERAGLQVRIPQLHFQEGSTQAGKDPLWKHKAIDISKDGDRVVMVSLLEEGWFRQP